MSVFKERLEGYFGANIYVNYLRLDGKTYPLDLKNGLKEQKVLSENGRHPVKAYLHQPTNKTVAIKFLRLPAENDTANQNKFSELANEIKLHKTLLPSSYVVDFYGVGIQDGRLLICIEHMDMSLVELCDKIHEKFCYFPERLLGYIAVAIVNGGDYLKKQNVMHRDIKPHNILINWSGEVKFCDFGVSRILESSLATTKVGTFAYWPPEHMDLTKPTEPYSVTTDVWSLGITLLELMYGNIPYTVIKSLIGNDYLYMQQMLKDLNVTELIGTCFEAKGMFYFTPFIRDLITICLEKVVAQRPDFVGLKATATYKNYHSLCNGNLNKAVQYDLKLFLLNQHYCSSCSTPLKEQCYPSYTHWLDHFNTHHPNKLRIHNSLPTKFPSSSIGSRLKQIIKEPNQQFYCERCKISISGVDNYNLHIIGKQHLKNAFIKPDIVPQNDTAPAKLLPTRSSNNNTTCSVCKITCSDSDALKQHMNGKSHAKMLSKSASSSIPLEQIYKTCNICKVTCTGPEPWKEHLNSKNHRNRLNLCNTKNSPTSSSNQETSATKFYCFICKIDCQNAGNLLAHKASINHKKKSSGSN